LDRKTNLASKPTFDPVLQDRALGAYVGLAVGDALGATVEFMTPREIHSHYGVHHKIIGGGWLKLKSGQVTDDTEMSLSLGRAILEAQGIDAQSIAQAYSDWMRSLPADIGNTVRRGIVHYRNSGCCEVPFSDHDAGNGACMRSLPVALAMLGADETQLRQASRAQAHITHHNDVSDQGTECVMRMVQCAIQGGLKQDLENLAQELISAEPLYAYSERTQENPTGYIVETLRAVFQAFFTSENFETAMVDVVNRGGDADTTGAILGMIAGAYYGIDAIPKQWQQALDQDVLQQCHDQALALLQLSPAALLSLR
jgi:ADP-ribosyl-[dinitrogen reductase] hydrolase